MANILNSGLKPLYKPHKCHQMEVILDFDTVQHEKLLCKLDSYVIGGPIHTWPVTFLYITQRYMQVVIKGETSCNQNPQLNPGYPIGAQPCAPHSLVSHK